MKLFAVKTEQKIDAGYYGEIDVDGMTLVFAETKEEAIYIYNKDFEERTKDCFVRCKAKTAFELDIGKVKRKRKQGYYIFK